MSSDKNCVHTSGNERGKGMGKRIKGKSKKGPKVSLEDGALQRSSEVL